MAFESLETTSTVAARLIREAIVEGRLAPGNPLREEELARTYGISRTPIREALRVLHAEGLVEMAANRGAWVKRYDADDLREIYTLRAVLEGYAAKVAAERIDEHTLTLLDESCDRYEKLGRSKPRNLTRLVQENVVFHGIVVDAAGSPRLAAMVRSLTVMPLIYRAYMTYSTANRRRAERDHRAITEALRARDGERAQRIEEEHILWSRDLATSQLPFAHDDYDLMADTT